MADTEPTPPTTYTKRLRGEQATVPSIEGEVKRKFKKFESFVYFLY